ncbi:LacI family DNA-binding transcriptional regulator [Xanthobacter autotrophicus]|uniref:LacI family DNA-binding transcriptional regulator n=1 Tax=Xanthobacter autotrophicus TaxID=280 RepID=UPI001E2C525D|nr:LacI family DNA-binding transcriptional regulator [Xanthobacter autotrophicus]UDQ91035.1 LacI family DNA-binding transcriptional regulator [Xanthobacter autotrophicus]
MPRIVTIRTVAERAGCSIATVSRVINRSAPTSAEVEARVRAAIDELGFRPSEIGRALKTLKTRTVGVLIPSLTNPVFAASVAGMQAAARERRHTLLLTATDYDPAAEAELVETLVAQNVAGLVLTIACASQNATLDLLEAESIPFVLVHNEPEGDARAAVCVDNAAATSALTEAMIAAGHRNIAYLAGRFATSDRSLRRYEGYRAAMEKAGLHAAAPLELDYLGDAPSHAAALAGLFRGASPPTAALCSNDLLALSVTGALRDLGIRVPDDVSVAGFDGIALGRAMSPSLATVDTPTRRMGEQAVELLFEMIETGAAPRVERLPFSLRSGGTLAAAPQPTRRQEPTPPSPPNT